MTYKEAAGLTLGEKIKQARLDRHMTQREVVGDYITRNMLSKIENNSATPSVKTLEFLATQLGLPAGYFVSDETPGSRSLAEARQAAADGRHADALTLLEQEAAPSEEQLLLLARCHLALAEAASRSGDGPEALRHAQAALEANGRSAYASPLTEAQAALLAARFDAARFDERLAQYAAACRAMDLDRMYHLTMAQHHLDAGDMEAAAAELAQLSGAEPERVRLAGELSMRSRDYRAAAEQLQRAEQLALSAGSSETMLTPLYAMLEQCFRELEDYKEAYHYAAKQIQR